jgi:hypothetical protein
MIGLPPGLPWPTIEATLHAAAPQCRHGALGRYRVPRARRATRRPARR